MNKTKDTIRDFIGKAGHHDTTVHESVDPAVTHETVKPTEHEDINTAVKKEVHQDHFHRTVQPVYDTEVLPEQHKHKIGKVQHREFDHRDHEGVKKSLESEGEKFKNERKVQDTIHTQAQASAIQGERVHHHIHESVQPVLHKETIQPSVVHTTVPIHETHHNPAQHHSTTSLPPVSMDQYKQSGGTLSGQRERDDAFEGEPQSIRGAVSSMHDKKDFAHEKSAPGVIPGKFDPPNAGRDHKRETHPVSQSQSASSRQAAESGTKEHHSLLDKLNPMTDTSGDGKPGFMR